ncbi:MAG: cell wall-active antibiotics response protein LiaF [bacterium]
MNAVIGIIIVILGIIFLGNNLGWFEYDLGDLISDWWPAVLIITGGWMIYYQTRRKGGSDWEERAGMAISKAVGDRQLKPTEIPTDGLVAKQGAGKLVLDLTSTRLNEGENLISLSQGAGEIKVVLPGNVAAKVTTSCGTGDIRVFDRKEDGISNRLEHEDDNYASASTRINLTVRLGLGEIKVTRE